MLEIGDGVLLVDDEKFDLANCSFVRFGFLSWLSMKLCRYRLADGVLRLNVKWGLLHSNCFP